MKAVVFSLGCKVNQYEGQSLISLLNENGIASTDKLEVADFYIINTCSVTAEADKKSRQMITKVLSKNADAQIFVCGCSSQNDKSAYTCKPNVKYVLGSASKQDVVKQIVEISRAATTSSKINTANINTEKTEKTVFDIPDFYEQYAFPANTKTRSFIKIQDGCNNFCSYCIVPYLRGRSRSRDVQSIIDECNKAATFTKEIVLTGINISDYGLNIGSSLTDLVLALGKVAARIRIGSLECGVISEPLLNAMKQANFCEHFHLSLQSGCDSVLKRMNRHYTTQFYADKVALIRKHFPNAAITTDIIAGFPEETDLEHEQTLEFIKKIKFADAHVFSYSKRVGTNAAKLVQLNNSIKDQRAKLIKQATNVSNAEFIASQINTVKQVFLEEVIAGYCVGYTENYIKVAVINNADNSLIGKLIKVKLKASTMLDSIHEQLVMAEII